MPTNHTIKCFMYVIMILAASGCQHQPGENISSLMGGPCTYVKIPGKAIIEEIKDADPTLNNCKNAVEVLFKFIPDDSTAPSRYLQPGWPDTLRYFTVGDGMNPPRGVD